MLIPGENEPDPPGGRAAERLREFLGQHMDESEAKEQEIEHGIDSAKDQAEAKLPPGKANRAS